MSSSSSSRSVSLQAYTSHFQHRNTIEVATFQNYFTGLLLDLNQAFRLSIPLVLLFTGTKGSGRKKFIRRLSRMAKADFINIINCSLFSTESRIWDRIYQECVKSDEEGDTSSNHNQLKLLFEKFLRKHKTVLYLENIQHFCEKRQTFLYSLLDNLALSGAQLCLVFGTSDLFFVEKLEKRVKSRFNFSSYVFDSSEQCPHDFIVKFALEIRHFEPHPTFMTWLRSDFTRTQVRAIMSAKFDLGSIVQLIQGALCCFTPELFQKSLENPDSPFRLQKGGNFASGTSAFESALARSVTALLGPSPRVTLADLPTLPRLALKLLAENAQVSKGNFTLSVKELIARVRAQRMTHEFSEEAVLFALEELLKNNLIAVVEANLNTAAKIFLRVNHEALEVLKGV